MNGWKVAVVLLILAAVGVMFGALYALGFAFLEGR